MVLIFKKPRGTKRSGFRRNEEWSGLEDDFRTFLAGRDALELSQARTLLAQSSA